MKDSTTTIIKKTIAMLKKKRRVRRRARVSSKKNIQKQTTNVRVNVGGGGAGKGVSPVVISGGSGGGFIPYPVQQQNIIKDILPFLNFGSGAPKQFYGEPSPPLGTGPNLRGGLGIYAVENSQAQYGNPIELNDRIGMTPPRIVGQGDALQGQVLGDDELERSVASSMSSLSVPSLGRSMSGDSLDIPGQVDLSLAPIPTDTVIGVGPDLMAGLVPVKEEPVMEPPMPVVIKQEEGGGAAREEPVPVQEEARDYRFVSFNGIQYDLTNKEQFGAALKIMNMQDIVNYLNRNADASYTSDILSSAGNLKSGVRKANLVEKLKRFLASKK